MESGDIVEYIDSNKIICSVILDVNKLRLRLLTENDREVKLSAARLSHIGIQRLDLDQSRSILVEHLKKKSSKRRNLSRQIDLEELWDTTNTEQEWIDLDTMTGLCFPFDPTGDHESAVIRAIFENRRFFKFKINRFYPHSPEQMDLLLKAEQEARRKKKLIDSGAALLKGTLSPETLPSDLEEILEILKSFYLYDKDSPHYQSAREIMKAAGTLSKDAVYNVMADQGIWSPDENLDIHRYDIPVGFHSDVNKDAERIPEFELSETTGADRKDLTHIPTITIDGQATLDFDDALSIEKVEGNYLVGIHIADVAHYIKRGHPIDREAFQRGSSIYMPDQKISMLPPRLAENICSLKKDKIRPTISTLVKISPRGEILSYDIFPSMIKVGRQLSYYDANLIVDEDAEIRTLYHIAEAFRKRRIGNGAIHISLPEINIWIDDDGAPIVTRVNRESPGRVLVAEFMILANWLTAKFLEKNKMPAVFRSQPAPRERVLKNSDDGLFRHLMQRKMLNRLVIATSAEHHSGLGLDAYVTGTSPIRKYFDLVTQRQVRAILGMERPYSKKEIDHLIKILTPTMGTVALIQRNRNRYWLLKHLEKRTGEKEEAIVIQKRRNAYLVLVKAYMLECMLPKSSGLNLEPEDIISLTFQHIKARNDVLSVFMG